MDNKTSAPQRLSACGETPTENSEESHIFALRPFHNSPLQKLSEQAAPGRHGMRPRFLSALRWRGALTNTKY
jgi:hypothetical protein